MRLLRIGIGSRQKVPCTVMGFHLFHLFTGLFQQIFSAHNISIAPQQLFHTGDNLVRISEGGFCNVPFQKISVLFFGKACMKLAEGIVPAGKPQGSRCVGKGALRGEEAEYKTAPGGISAQPVRAVDTPGTFPAGKHPSYASLTAMVYQDSAVGSVKERGDADRVFADIQTEIAFQPCRIICYIASRVRKNGGIIFNPYTPFLRP